MPTGRVLYFPIKIKPIIIKTPLTIAIAVALLLLHIANSFIINHTILQIVVVSIVIIPFYTIIVLRMTK